ncbi:MAG: molybdopterin-guanine dinucleotide biosynthesis protein B [Deltaproteobacteria bacterium]|nr:molybdopterin-guanine dinucleotide biosynthesis protein B [Deltaproteobacteria bacterium]
MVPIICIVGGSGSGKTTYLEGLIPELRARGLRVGTIKHHGRDFEMDYPGKDSWRHKRAGSSIAMISSPLGIGMVMDVDHDHRPDELLRFFPGVDVILCEGYKGEDKPKVEIFRPEVHERPFCMGDKNLIALVTDREVEIEVPRFRFADKKGLADLLIKRFDLAKRNSI